MNLLFDCLKQLLENNIVKEKLLTVSDYLRAVWYLLKLAKDEDDYNKVIKILEVLSQIELNDYELKTDDYEFMDNITNA
jgi:hypothetical protein